jgi:hypothetical protein
MTRKIRAWHIDGIPVAYTPYDDQDGEPDTPLAAQQPGHLTWEDHPAERLPHA